MNRRHIHIVCLVLLLFLPYIAFAQGSITPITYQYWLDDNTDAAITDLGNDAGDGLGINLNLDVGSLSPGVHYYNIRAAEDEQWGAVQRFIFSIPTLAEDVPPSLIVKYIYWLDDDYEHRVETPVGEYDEEFTTTTIPAIASFDVSSLAPGVHYYNVRILDSNNMYSTTQRFIFSIPAVDSGDEPADLKNIEYWFDDDYANRVSTTASSSQATTASLNISEVDVSSLAPGVHYYNMRTQDEDGIWGAPQRFIFSIPAASSGTEPADLQLYEYWIDNDYANRKSKQITDDEYTTDGTFASIDMTGLDPGVHFYNMRAQDENGIWGAPQRFIFSIPTPQTSAADKLIAGYSYAFNFEDPTIVALDTPVDEYTLELSDLPVPDPEPLMVVDDDCTMTFDATAGTAQLSRNVPMTFAVYFKDQSNTLSAPTVEEFEVNDVITEDVQTIASPGTYAVESHAEGGYSAMSFAVESSTILALKANGDCSLRLYNPDGELIIAYESTALQTGVTMTFAAGSYYAIVFGNSEARKLALYPGDETGMEALKPTISYDADSHAVTISSALNGTIYYTNDGSDPTLESTQYTAPFTVTKDIVKAIAAWGDMVVSPIYTFNISQMKGDASGDGTIDIADVTAIINYILGNPSSTFAENLADMNGDGVVDIFDAMLLVNYVLTHPTSASGARAMERVGADEPAEAIELSAEQDHIYIGVDQAERFTAFQFDIILPDGVSPSDVKLTSISSAHRLMFARCYDNIYRVVGFSMSNSTFPSVDDKFVDIQLTDVANGEISVINVLFVRPDLQKTIFAGGTLGTTAIENIEIDSEATDIYNLKGQKLDNNRKQLDKGVYIINHKKVIIK